MPQNNCLAFAFIFLAAGVLSAEPPKSPKGQAFGKFTSDGAFFTAQIPSGWEKAEEIILGRQEKRYGVDLTAPKRAEGAFINISLIYIGPDHLMFKTYEKYIAKNLEMPRKKKGEQTMGPKEIVFNGRKALSFEIQRYEAIPPGAPKPNMVLIYQKQIVIPAKKGFYVVILESPKSAAKSYLGVFDKIGASFKPNPNL